MRRSACSLLLVLLVSGLAACAGSRVEDSWTDPSVAGRPLGLHKVATIAMLQEGALRRVAEDDLARAIGQSADILTVPSYRLLRADQLDDFAQVRAALAAEGCDGAMVVEVVDTQQRIRSTPGLSTAWGGPAWGRFGWGVVYDVGEIRSDTIVRVQTNVYAVADGKLLWSATSRSINPDDVSDLIRDVVRDAGGALREQGLLP